MRAHGIVPRVFFAPSHTFDENTLTALRECSAIRILSDTVANDVYTKDGFTFVPQQTGSVRALPLKTVTFCYHPNVMDDATFERWKRFLRGGMPRLNGSLWMSVIRRGSLPMTVCCKRLIGRSDACGG